MPDLDAEIRWTRGRVLGEAAWRRLCQAGGLDPKDPELDQRRLDFVAAVQSAAFVMEDSGFEGLEDWLELERAGIDDDD